jgi:hypothetical protein
VKRVVIWMLLETFLSLVQKIGRCVRNLADLGEAIIYVTHSAYQQAVIELELAGQGSDAGDDNNGSDSEDADDGSMLVPQSDSAVIDREEALELVEGEEEAVRSAIMVAQKPS